MYIQQKTFLKKICFFHCKIISSHAYCDILWSYCHILWHFTNLFEKETAPLMCYSRNKNWEHTHTDTQTYFWINTQTNKTEKILKHTHTHGLILLCLAFPFLFSPTSLSPPLLDLFCMCMHAWLLLGPTKAANGWRLYIRLCPNRILNTQAVARKTSSHT